MVALDEQLLEELATALGVTPEFVKSFRDEHVIYNIQNNNNTSNDNSVDQSYSQYMQPTLNNDGLDKLVALLEKFIEEDRAKIQSIAALSKAVIDLTNEVKKMKEGK